ncbi:hypothetical protein D3C79_1101130 [compost metagenome]
MITRTPPTAMPLEPPQNQAHLCASWAASSIEDIHRKPTHSEINMVRAAKAPTTQRTAVLVMTSCPLPSI